MESAARSYAISGKQSHLGPFYTAAKAVPQQIDDLKGLLRGDPTGLKDLTEIEPVIGQHLNFDMARFQKISLQIDAFVAEGSLGLGLGGLKSPAQFFGLVYDAHAAAPAAGSRLDQEREADLVAERPQLLQQGGEALDGAHGQAGPLNARAPPSIGGFPLDPASSAVRSFTTIQFGNRPRPGTRSQRELKLGFPGLVSSRLAGARNDVKSSTFTRFVLSGIPPAENQGVRQLGVRVGNCFFKPMPFCGSGVGIALHHLRPGMPKPVVKACGNDSKARSYGLQEIGRAGGCASVMSDLQEVGLRRLLFEQLFNEFDKTRRP